MTIAEWLVKTMVDLRDAGVDSPRRDCLVLLEDVLGVDRAWILAHHEHILNNDKLKEVNALIGRRIAREPLAYIRGKAWFYRRFFDVNKNVLIPRPESENFIDMLVSLRTKKIIDIGTGSGALAITAALEIPDAQVLATDTSSSALELAQHNATAHSVNVKFLLGSLLEPLQETDVEHAVIITNLPYVPVELITSPEIEVEPKEALFSGSDGLDHYKLLWQQIKQHPTRPDYILTESLESQHDALTQLASEAGYKLTSTNMLIQQFENQSGSSRLR